VAARVVQKYRDECRLMAWFRCTQRLLPLRSRSQGLLKIFIFDTINAGQNAMARLTNAPVDEPSCSPNAAAQGCRRALRPSRPPPVRASAPPRFPHLSQLTLVTGGNGSKPVDCRAWFWLSQAA